MFELKLKYDLNKLDEFYKDLLLAMKTAGFSHLVKRHVIDSFLFKQDSDTTFHFKNKPHTIKSVEYIVENGLDPNKMIAKGDSEVLSAVMFEKSLTSFVKGNEHPNQSVLSWVKRDRSADCHVSFVFKNKKMAMMFKLKKS